jgi:AhpD family alkylhydroperoxidase
MRASQINGCVYCLDTNSNDARALGESEERLHLLAAWRWGPLLTRESGRPWPGVRTSPDL